MDGNCSGHDSYGKRRLVGEPDLRPKLPAWGYNYAMAQAKRLKLAYPKGLTGRDLANELGLSPKGAKSAMNRHDFYTFDNHYRWEDVGVMLMYRQVKRMAQLDELIGG